VSGGGWERAAQDRAAPGGQGSRHQLDLLCAGCDRSLAAYEHWRQAHHAPVLEASGSPSGVGANLCGHPTRWQAGELTRERRTGRRQASFLDRIAVRVENDDVRVLVSQVQSNGCRAILKHGRFLLLAPLSALRLCSSFRSSTLTEGPAFSFQTRCLPGPPLRSTSIPLRLASGAPKEHRDRQASRPGVPLSSSKGPPVIIGGRSP